MSRKIPAIVDYRTDMKAKNAYASFVNPQNPTEVLYLEFKQQGEQVRWALVDREGREIPQNISPLLIIREEKNKKLYNLLSNKEKMKA